MKEHSLPKVFVVGVAACILAAACAFFQIDGPSIYGPPQTVVAAAVVPAPAYAPNGDMLPVAEYREWIYLSSGLGMTYSPQPGGMIMFDNVFVNPGAYRSFVATGTWPDKTVMVLESRGAESKGSINQSGHYQSTSVMGFAIHVKDEARFPGKWAFFLFNSPSGNGKLIPREAACYTCHAAHGAVDTTFVQFYPTLLPIARDKKTLSDTFLKDEAAQADASK